MRNEKVYEWLKDRWSGILRMKSILIKDTTKEMGEAIVRERVRERLLMV